MKNALLLAIMSLLVLLVCLLTSGCYSRTFKQGDVSYTSWGLFTNQVVAPFTVEVGDKNTPGYKRLESKGLSNTPDPVIYQLISDAYNAGKKAATP